ncbi:hypothetical protein [Flagellimonas aurea]|uniref:hypothetical protein n=1 Tax=Flagellimonas aurea TaxID=2915619 RepID=UPI0035D099DD
MKKNGKELYGLFLKSLLFISASLLLGCDDDDDLVIITYHYAQNDAEEALAISLSYASYGFVANMSKASTEIQENYACDQWYYENESISEETVSGHLSYEYSYEEEFRWSCDPIYEVDYNLMGMQHLSFGSNVKYLHDIGVDFQVTGLEENSPYENYEGTYSRFGDWQSDYNGEGYYFTFRSEILEAKVSKSSNKITSGTVNFRLTQDYRHSQMSYTYEGTVEFINEDEARVIYDSGEVFYIDLTHASISRLEF